MTIPASEIVAVTPSVISGGGSGLDLVGVALTPSARMPGGTLLSFPSAASVTAYFGVGSPEDLFGQTYFLGFDNSNIKPAALLFYANPTGPTSAFLRGVPPPGGATLQNIQTITGTLSLIIDGTTHTASALSLAAATSLSGAASMIATGLALTNAQVIWDPLALAFTISSITTGATSTITAASGTAAHLLGLDAASAPTISQGQAAGTPGAVMDAVKQRSQNWATFGTITNPDAPGAFTNKLAFAAWVNAQNRRYVYVAWDSDGAPAATPPSACFGQALAAGNYDGTAAFYAPVLGNTMAAFIMGTVASIDFTETNGRITIAFKSQTGITPDVTDDLIQANVRANGYSFYGAYATANQAFQFAYPGSISGPFKWIDSYVNQIWFNNAVQLALMMLMTQAKSLPYNQAGYAMVSAALQDPIDQALNFGMMAPGVPLSNLEASLVNQAAGTKIDQILFTGGYYKQVLPATAQVRANRGSPPATIWYMDPGSIQQLDIASVAIL
jgi:Protein of unknown function (DUF3383)